MPFYQIRDMAQYHRDYARSMQEPESFWAEIAAELSWILPWNKVLEWDFSKPDVKWFSGGQINVTVNCLDRHAVQDPGRLALIWEPNDPQEPTRAFTYRELLEQVCQYAAMLKEHGVHKGDRVCIYMGMVPELLIAMMACARLGAIHSVVFGGFSAGSVRDRLIDCEATFVITCDGAWRGSREIPLKPVVDQALEQLNFIKKVFVLKRTGTMVSMDSHRDFWIHENLDPEITFVEAEPMESEDPLFILYTSGSTGKPKGVVHSTAGYLLWAHYTFLNVFQYQPGQIHFCTADIGWITGHSYIAYGPLSCGGTSLMFEGIPTWPDASRLWKIIDKHKVNILYTAPTAIRSLMSYGDSPFDQTSLETLEVLGTVGEPINEEAWHWYDTRVGKSRIPIVDTWWQTETGGIMISNLAGVSPAKASYATLPLPGISPLILDASGAPTQNPLEQGILVIEKPWPGMIRTTYRDHERCRLNYFSQFPGMYFTGDGAYRDETGDIRIIGRIDDVLNVSGHRIGTAELENIIDEHPGVIESAVVGFPHDIKGQGIRAFVICTQPLPDPQKLKQEITELIVQAIGPIAKPDLVQIVPGLPKTRSGKIMRRILRKIAEGERKEFGDITSLLDMEVVQQIAAGADEIS
jgi:acetyl-CoA synthetase